MGFKAPLAGEWYSDVVTGQTFEVVALDDQASTIEIQYLHGEVSEIDSENWLSMNLEIAAAPEDWSAPYEIDREDSGLYETNGNMNVDPLNTIEPDIMLGFDELY